MTITKKEALNILVSSGDPQLLHVKDYLEHIYVEEMKLKESLCNALEYLSLVLDIKQALPGPLTQEICSFLLEHDPAVGGHLCSFPPKSKDQ